MDFQDTADAARFRAHVRTCLTSDTIQDRLRVALGSRDEGDPRPLYAALGERGLLAASWPTEFGGMGHPPSYSAIVLEELIRHRVPDTLFVISIQAVAELLIAAGSTEQQATILPRMARGELLASILYTEPESGSDLARMATVANARVGGYSIFGTKVWSLNTRFTDVALCAALTPTEGATDRFSLFLVDLDLDGVQIEVVPSIARQQFHAVRFDDVMVPASSMIGAEGQGRALTIQTLSLERSGLDAAIRAEQWCEMVRTHPASRFDPKGRAAAKCARYTARSEAARLLAWKALLAGATDPVLAAKSKWYCSELASEIARWAVQFHWPTEPYMEEAYREAPGLTIAGGTSEVMLMLASSSLGSERGSA